ncbi:hypothetical protein CBL_01253 [Carabus blaptoides fortunei]
MSAAFLQILCLLDQVSPESTDLIGSLPTELVSTIFRYLDPKSLSRVNRCWRSVCASDVVLSGRIRKYLREEKEACHQNYLEPSRSIEITRKNPGIAFGRRNGNVCVRTVPVQYDLNNNVVPLPKGRFFRITASQQDKNEKVRSSKKFVAGLKQKTTSYSRLRI